MFVLISSCNNIIQGQSTELMGVTPETSFTSDFIANSTHSETTETSEVHPEAYQYDYYDLPLTIVSRYMIKIYPPILLIVGVFGNILSIIIMKKPSFSNSPTSLYFIMLASKFFVCLFFC